MNENNYFNEDIQSKIKEMSGSQCNQLLVELESTVYWIAILKYIQQRMVNTQSGLMTIDPIAKASEMCRLQGILLGLSDLQGAIIALKQQEEKNTPEKITKKVE
jgi:citrate lyase beta subunit